MEENEVRCYKGRYMIMFYDVDDDTLVYCFENTSQILHFLGVENCIENRRKISILIWKAIRRIDHKCFFMNNKELIIHLEDIRDEDIENTNEGETNYGKQELCAN